MRKLSIMLCTTLISVSTSLPSAAQETDLNSCNARVAACEQVIGAAQKYIVSLNTELEKKNELIVALEHDRALLEQQVETNKPAWFERPSFVIPATILATAATIFIVRKAAE